MEPRREGSGISEVRWLEPAFVHTTDRVEAELHRAWSLADMAEVTGYSPFHFHRAFRAAVGETPTAFVERLRLERAALLLLASDTPITHLAWDVGFRNPDVHVHLPVRDTEAAPAPVCGSAPISSRRD